MKQTLYFFAKTIKEYIKEEFLGLFLSIVYTTTVFLSPQISKFLMDNVLINYDYQKLYKGIFAFFFICIVQTISSYIKNKLFLKVSEKITLSFRKKILKHLINVSMEFFDSVPKGFIFSRFFDDSKSISDFVTNVFVVIVKNLFLIIAITFGMFLLSWKITLLIFILLFTYILLSVLAANRFKYFSKISLHSNDLLHKDFSQSIDNVFLTRTFCLQNYYYQKNEKNLKEIFKINLKIGNFNNLVNSLSSIVVVLSLSIIYGFGAFLSFKNEISIGSIVALGIYFQMLVGPIGEMVNSNTHFQQIVPVVKRLEEYLNLKYELSESKIDINSISSPISISFNSVYFNKSQINKNNYILQNINFEFKDNGIYGLFGASGSGKTTILKLLFGLYLPTKGNINISSPEGTYSPQQLRHKISYVPQNLELLNASISENLKLFDDSISNEEMISICKFLHLYDKIMSLQNNYESIISEKINFSEGEKQRICIARAVLKKSPIYVFDEPTAFLDKDSKLQLKCIIDKLAKESIVIVVSHDPYIFKNAQKIVVINKGKIIKKCNYKELIQKCKIKGKIK